MKPLLSSNEVRMSRKFKKRLIRNKKKHFWKSMMVIFSAFKDAHDELFESKYVLNHFLKKSTIFQMFQTSDFLQVNRSHFSISFHLHMSSMNTLLYSSWCIKRPRDSLNQNLGPQVNCQPSHWRQGS